MRTVGIWISGLLASAIDLRAVYGDGHGTIAGAFAGLRALISIKAEHGGFSRVVSAHVLLGVDRRGVFFARLLSLHDYSFDRGRGGDDRLIRHFDIGKSASLSAPCI
jgi:hypothetical protein